MISECSSSRNLFIYCKILELFDVVATNFIHEHSNRDKPLLCYVTDAAKYLLRSARVVSRTFPAEKPSKRALARLHLRGKIAGIAGTASTVLLAVQHSVSCRRKTKKRSAVSSEAHSCFPGPVREQREDHDPCRVTSQCPALTFGTSCP